MVTVVLIGSVAILVAIVGCVFIWRADVQRADEVEQAQREVRDSGARRLEAAPERPDPPSPDPEA